MTTSYVWVVLLVLTIICILSSVPRKSFDKVLDKKCREITAGSDVKNDYKWGGQVNVKKHRNNVMNYQLLVSIPVYHR
jgi:hypothetical protein